MAQNVFQGRAVVNTGMNVEVYEIRKISLPAEGLLASE
jgi:hypothetical protein